MNDTAATAAVRQLSDDIRSAVLERTAAPPVLVHSLPDLSLHHAAGSVRVGHRFTGWVWRVMSFHPGAFACVCWAGWYYARAASQAAASAGPIVTIVRDNDGHPVLDAAGHVIQSVAPMAPISATAAQAAAWFQLFALFFTVGAIVAGFHSATSRPTHHLGRDGRLHAVRGHTSMARRRRGGYTRVNGRRRGVSADWKAAKRDAAAAERRLARAGAWQRRRWERQWAAERAAGVPEHELTRPGRVAETLMKRAPKKADAATVAKRAKRRERALRVALEEAEFDAELARIKAADAARAAELLEVRPRPGHDPAAPVLAPGAHATTIEPAPGSAQEFLIELAAAQSNGSEP